jgi:hypothetical protein
MKSIINQIKKELRQNADENLKRSGERFFKEKVKMYGMKTAQGIQLGKKYWKEIQGREFRAPVRMACLNEYHDIARRGMVNNVGRNL